MSGPLIFSNPFDYRIKHHPPDTPCVERANPLSLSDLHSRKPHLLPGRHGLHFQDPCEADVWTLNHIDTGERWCSPVLLQKDEAYSQPRHRRNAITSIPLEGDEKAKIMPDESHDSPKKPSLGRRKTNVFDLIKPVDESGEGPSPPSAKTKTNPHPENLSRITVNLTPTMNLGCFEPSRSESSESMDYITYQRRPALGYIFDACPGYPQVRSPVAETDIPRTQAEVEMMEKMTDLEVGVGRRRRPELCRRVSRFTFIKVKTLFERL